MHTLVIDILYNINIGVYLGAFVHNIIMWSLVVTFWSFSCVCDRTGERRGHNIIPIEYLRLQQIIGPTTIRRFVENVNCFMDICLDKICVQIIYRVNFKYRNTAGYSGYVIVKVGVLNTG